MTTATATTTATPAATVATPDLEQEIKSILSGMGSDVEGATSSIMTTLDKSFAHLAKPSTPPAAGSFRALTAAVGVTMEALVAWAGPWFVPLLVGAAVVFAYENFETMKNLVSKL